MPPVSDYYAILGITRDATPEEIRRAYHRAVRLTHPDTREGGLKTSLFHQTQEAFEMLSSEDKRAEYDKSLPPLETAPGNIGISITYSRTAMPRIDEPQLVYALIEVEPPPEAKYSPRPPLNVCLVIDRSTSMQGERIDTVKRTAIELTQQLLPEDILSIVSFSDRAEVLVPAERHPETRGIQSQIQRLVASGGTEIYQGLETAFLEIRRVARPDYIDHIILLTDGRTYGDEAACLQLADQAAVYGVGISCLGIGVEWNDSLLDSLALRTGGSIMFISQPIEIRHFLKQKISRLNQVYAEQVSLKLTPTAMVELNYAFRRNPDPAPLAVTSPILLGNIPSKSDLVFILELKVAPSLPKISQLQLLKGKLTMELSGSAGIKHPIQLDLTISVSDSIDPTPPPTRLLQSVSHLTLYRMQARAQQYIDEGNTEQAGRYLNNLATQLFSHGEYDLARTVLKEVDNLNHDQGLSEAGKKQIKYGTRALFFPGEKESKPLNQRGGDTG
jgi:Ca-activated chloride channel family protein